jgi:hypothetical protein
MIFYAAYSPGCLGFGTATSGKFYSANFVVACIAIGN